MSDTQPCAWFPDELGLAGRENLDPRHVAAYDLKEDAGAAAEVELLLSLGIGPESRVVEFGPGTGQFTVAIAPHCREVVAVEVSPVMIDRLQANIERLGLTNVRIVRSGFVGYHHDAPPVDAIYSRFALHHLPDFWKVVALDRMRRMLRADGVLRLSDVVFDFGPEEVVPRIEAWCASYGPASEQSWGRSDIEEHVRDEHSTFSWLLEPMIERAGFSIERAEYSPDGLLAAYILRRSRRH